MITKLDIHLLTRIGKLLLEDAAAIESSETPWSADKASKAAKRTHDRILREARDLKALRVRLQADVIPADPPPADDGVRT